MNRPIGKTIQIFLPDGNPRGLKIAEFTSRTVRAVLVPRAQLEFACERPELSNVGLYMLFGEGGAGKVQEVYIGEAEDCLARIKQHNKSKDWWTTAIVCVSKTGGFTKSHVKYLEWFCFQEARNVGRFKVDNTNIPTKSYISEPMEADILDQFDTMRILTSTLGYPLFDRIQKPQPKNLLVCETKHAKAYGEYTEDGMVVFAGGICNKEVTQSIHGYLVDIRKELQEEGILKQVDDKTLQFTKDYVFPSPSQAAAVVIGGNANGWIMWKYSDGRTLDKVIRKSDKAN